MLCAKFDSNGQNGSEEDILQIFTISLSSPLEEGSGPSFKQTLIPLPKNALCQVWLKLAKWFWRRRFLNIFNIILLFCYYLPLEKGIGPSFEETLFPLPNNVLCPSLVEIGPVVFSISFTILLLSPLGKGRGPSFEQT